MMRLYGRDLITTQDWSVDELHEALRIAKELKKLSRMGKPWAGYTQEEDFLHGLLCIINEDKSCF
jgi:ornithine carbamoyltransferase